MIDKTKNKVIQVTLDLDTSTCLDKIKALYGPSNSKVCSYALKKFLSELVDYNDEQIKNLCLYIKNPNRFIKGVYC